MFCKDLMHTLLSFLQKRNAFSTVILFTFPSGIQNYASQRFIFTDLPHKDSKCIGCSYFTNSLEYSTRQFKRTFLK